MDVKDGAPVFTQAQEIFPCARTPTAQKSVQCLQVPCACTFVFACVGKLKSWGNNISRICHWLPLHPQSPECYYTTDQISHYEDEWVHKNTITYHSACKIPCELLTEQLIRAIGVEAQRTEFLGRKWWKTDESFLPRTHGQWGLMPRRTGRRSTHKWQYITTTLIYVHIHTHSHAHTGHILFIQLWSHT